MNPPTLEVSKNPHNYQSDMLEERFSSWILDNTRGPPGPLPTSVSARPVPSAGGSAALGWMTLCKMGQLGCAEFVL